MSRTFDWHASIIFECRRVLTVITHPLWTNENTLEEVCWIWMFATVCELLTVRVIDYRLRSIVFGTSHRLHVFFFFFFFLWISSSGVQRLFEGQGRKYYAFATEEGTLARILAPMRKLQPAFQLKRGQFSARFSAPPPCTSMTSSDRFRSQFIPHTTL